MKRSFTILALLLLTAGIFAQAPQKMSYQAVIRDAGNHLVTTQVGMQISILQGSESGTAVYVETQTPTPSINGLVTIEIGTGTLVSGNFSTINWANGPYFIKTETAVVPPLTTYTITGTSELLSVPFALHAKSAASYNETDPEVGVNTTNYLSKWNGTALVSSTLFDNGKVGIGTASPGGYLEITDKGDHMPNNLLILGQTETSNRLRFSSGTNYAIISVGPTMDENKGLTIMHSSGYIGMGKSDPSTKLDVNGVITSNGANFTGTTTVPTPVNPTDAATKAYVDKLLSIIQIIQVGVKDGDGNTYKVILIGDQVWMAENLKTTRYSDGTPIPLITDNSAWSALSSPGYCWYNNDQATYGNTYGALYNWYTVLTGMLCPAGWHVPSDTEWATMANYLITSGYNYDGTTSGNKIAKALAATTNWTLSSVAGAAGNTDYPAKRNASGFTAYPGGNRSSAGTYSLLGTYGHWWSATESTPNAIGRYLRNADIFIGLITGDKRTGFSVRCVRD
ncbi:MAG: fibrobacter succinogenes major paralogous domain-containing protein [Bacteroidales bacterium]|jgi:uncharacterized protein (TIGR02145 family)|nr:fibrobacter succinogenes major paralogous domain-containing protein [Bacteroidales bacterium]